MSLQAFCSVTLGLSSMHFLHAHATEDDDSVVELSTSECVETSLCSPTFQKQVYATTKPLYDRDMSALLFPDLITSQGDDTHMCGLGCKYIFTDSCTRMHQPFTNHLEFGLTVPYVESQLKNKWAHVMDPQSDAKYDSFLDNNVAFWAPDLTNIYHDWMAAGVDVVILHWYADADKKRTRPMYSIITHHPDTLTQYEVISDSFDYPQDVASQILDSEPRAHFAARFTGHLLDDYSQPARDCTLYPIGSRRAVTSVEENVKWFKKIFAATLKEDVQVITGQTLDYKGDVVKYAHIRVENWDVKETTTVSFFERSEGSTFGDLSIKTFENGMNEAHEEAMVSPFCGIDRWFDNHFAMFLGDTSYSLDVLQAVMESGHKYTVYSGMDHVEGENDYYLYLPEPNGHSTQLLFSADVEWYFEPTTWDADWCPLGCKDGNDAVKFGDVVFNPDTSVVTFDGGLAAYRIVAGAQDKNEFVFGWSGLRPYGSMLFVLFAVVCTFVISCFVCMTRNKVVKDEKGAVNEYAALLA